MKKEELLRIFRMEELYNRKKDMMPFVYHFTNSMNIGGTDVIYYFRQHEIAISFTTKDFSENNEEKYIYLTFEVDNDNNLTLLKDKHHFKNDCFPHLDFETTFEADLEFVSGVIHNVFIPKYDLTWEYSKINY